MNRSHLFVIHGDLNHVHADGYLIPADCQLAIEPRWQTLLAGLPAPRLQQPTGSHRRGIKLGVLERPRPGAESTDEPDEVLLLVSDVASVTEDLARLTRSLELALDAAAGHWEHNASTARRERPLLAMPLIGCGGGGFHRVQGAVVAALLRTLDTRLPGLSFDVALICFERAQYAAVQSTRADAELCLPDLPGDFNEQAAALAKHAGDGTLGVLFGAGVSMPLGLPDWQTLLTRLAQGTATEDLGDLSRLDPMDAASLVLDGLRPGPGTPGAQEEFKRRLGLCVNTPRHSLTHGLLASLRPAVAVTTNYDRGYELALQHVLGSPPAVLPWDPPVGGTARIVKLHGDVEHGSVVLTRDDFVVLHATRRPLTALLQEQMLAQHVLAIGTSMSDSTLVSAIAEAAALLRSINRKRPLGTLVMTQHDPARAHLLKDSLDVIPADRPPQPGVPRLQAPAAARVSDLLLDAIALRSMRELSYLADSKFEDLLKKNPTLLAVADLARQLRAAIDATDDAGHPRWLQARQALDALGATGQASTTVHARADRAGP